MTRVRVRLAQIVVLGVLAIVATVPLSADQASCDALCAMQEAYCDAKGGTLVGDCYWIPDGDICNLNGCRLPIIE